MKWGLGAEYWSGVESDFGVTKVEWECSTFATPKSDSTPSLRSKTPLHKIHGVLNVEASNQIWSTMNSQFQMFLISSPSFSQGVNSVTVRGDSL